MLDQLRPIPGSREPRKRIGRGVGSGTGKTAGKGHKGQNARAGSGTRLGFEGGQMPLQRRLPKRGFKNIFADPIGVVTTQQLNRFDGSEPITIGLLKKTGLVKKSVKSFKVIAKGAVEHKLEVHAAKCSAGALKILEAQGGSLKIAEKPKRVGK